MVMTPIEQPIDLAPEGLQLATIVAVNDIGLQETQYTDESQPKKRPTLEFYFRLDAVNADGEHFVVKKWETNKIQPANRTMRESGYHKLLTRGLNLRLPRGGSFDSSDIIGSKLYVKIQHQKKRLGPAVNLYANVIDYVSLEAGRKMQTPTVVKELKKTEKGGAR